MPEENALQVVREKVFRRLRQELPYEIDVVPKSYEVLKDGSLLFRHNIIVPTESVSKLSDFPAFFLPFSGPAS